MKRLITITTWFVALLFTFGLHQQAAAQGQEIQNPDIRVGVDGLACPFCAYGIEKKLKKIDEIDKLYVNLKKGTVDLKLKKGTAVSEAAIKKAVDKAGFEVRSIEYLHEDAKPATEDKGKE